MRTQSSTRYILVLLSYFLYSFSPSSYVIMSFQDKIDGAEQSSVRNIWYSKVKEEPPAISETCFHDTFQQLTLNSEAPLPV